jgi:hypothetical protein
MEQGRNSKMRSGPAFVRMHGQSQQDSSCLVIDTDSADQQISGAEANRWHFPSLKRLDLDGAQTAMLRGVLLITLLAYLRCLGNGMVYDDHPMIVDNHYIGQWSFLGKSLTRDVWWFLGSDRTTHSAYYRPLENVWLGLGYHLTALNPVGWHLLKIALHLIVVLLTFRLAQQLTGNVSAALLTALNFGILPVHAEAVVWATAIPEPLSAAFELGALYLFVQRPNAGWGRLLWPLILFALALLSHESAVVFPVLVAAYVFILETARPWRLTDTFSDLR